MSLKSRILLLAVIFSFASICVKAQDTNSSQNWQDNRQERRHEWAKNHPKAAEYLKNHPSASQDRRQDRRGDFMQNVNNKRQDFHHDKHDWKQDKRQDFRQDNHERRLDRREHRHGNDNQNTQSAE